MKYITKSVFVVLLVSHFANASIVVGGTRLVFDGNNDETSINVENKDSKANLVQSWLSIADPHVTNKQAFIITPPLFRLDAGQKNSIRVIRSGESLPEDRESMYWLNIKGIPSIDDNAAANRVEISINTQIKLIYRPSALTKSTPDSQSQQLKWQAAGDTITVNNPTPYYMNFASVTLNGHEVKSATFVPPQSSASFKLSSAVAAHGTVMWRLISDYGMSLEQHSASF